MQTIVDEWAPTLAKVNFERWLDTEQGKNLYRRMVNTVMMNPNEAREYIFEAWSGGYEMGKVYKK